MFDLISDYVCSFIIARIVGNLLLQLVMTLCSLPVMNLIVIFAILVTLFAIAREFKN
ncbi:hypothetical protein STW0522KLE44_P60020 (plasmid) [Klebsiella sp. STW0522-44]|nr:hypothetical protein STW0522KLE44_P60020 [Klebsiella sp. STW0522-44]